jgi:pimeloyl-ACP methyl ester carboxylesterase
LNPSSGFAPVNGTRLYYELAGEGEPLVLIHGFTLDRRMWDAQVEPFARQYRVLNYDGRGFGKSAAPDGTEYDRAEDLKALLDGLGIERAHIVGLSMGGGVAIDFALAYPEMTRSLIAVDSVLSGHHWSEEWDNTVKPIWQVGRAGDVEGARRLWLDHALFAPARERPAVKERLDRIVGEYSGWHWLYRDKVRDRNAASQLERIGAPTLSVTGERDLPDFHAVANALEQKVKAKKVILPRAGHMSPMEDPEAFNRVALEFLASV